MQEKLEYSKVSDLIPYVEDLLDIWQIDLTLDLVNNAVVKMLNAECSEPELQYERRVCRPFNEQVLDDTLKKITGGDKIDWCCFNNASIRLAVVFSFSVNKCLTNDNTTLSAQIFYKVYNSVSEEVQDMLCRDLDLVKQTVNLECICKLLPEGYEYLPVRR